MSPGKVAQFAVRRETRRGPERTKIRVRFGILAPVQAGKPGAVRYAQATRPIGQGAIVPGLPGPEEDVEPVERLHVPGFCSGVLQGFHDFIMGRGQVPSIKHPLSSVRDVTALVVFSLEVDDALKRVERHDGDELGFSRVIPPKNFDASVPLDSLLLDSWEDLPQKDGTIGLRVFGSGPPVPDPFDCHSVRFSDSTNVTTLPPD
jgi:hypothetical protein